MPFQWCITCPRHIKIAVVKPKKTNMQSFSDCISWWSKKPQWGNNCGYFLPCFLLAMIIQNKSTIMSVRSAMISWFCVRPTSKRWFLKMNQVTMKHYPFDAMQESMQTLHLSCIHILCWSLKHNAKQTWTSSAFSTNEST